MKYLKGLLTLLAAVFISGIAQTQNVGINTTGATPNSSAILDLTTGNSGKSGFLPEWVALAGVNDAVTVANPATGLLVYNPGTGGLAPAGYYYNSGTSALPVWTLTGISSGWGLTGNAGTNAATNFIGTTDFESFNIKVDNNWAGRIDVSNGCTNYGYLAGNYPTNTGFDNTAIGYEALTGNTSGGENTAAGYEALFRNTTGTQNTATGYEALNTNSTGSYNTAVGSQTLFSNSTGTNNTAIGFDCLLSNTTGTDNTAMGDQALYSNTIGLYNTGLGDSTLYLNTRGSDNTACGRGVLKASTTASSNTAMGSFSMHSNTKGSFNTAFGDSALYTNTTGTGNTCLGFSADVGSGALTNATAIGYNATVANSNSMVFGNGNVTSWLFGNATYSATKALVVGTNATNGNGAYLTSTGNWNSTSDRNKKEHFKAIDGEELLNKIDMMPITRWNYKGEDPSIQHIGPMAQDFYKLFKVGNDSVTLSSIDPSGIALAAIQTLNRKLKLANNENALLKAQLNSLADTQKKLTADKVARDKRLADQEKEIAELKQMLNALAPAQASVK